ncbi:MAG: polysaccharide deacetylase family protein [Erysipelotrichaceae bacterium]|nr:polysaccharide deacetylase family protein [Erysipelotrichaceae bacterium]
MFRRLYFILLQRFYVMKQKKKPCQGKVFMFHKVDEEDDLYAISPEHFRELLEDLLKNRKIVDIDTLITEKDAQNVAIGFDDVYESVYRNAYPLLKEKDVPYYLFMCNEYLDQKDYLKTDMIKEMLEDSKAILASHHYQHVLSRFMKEEELKEELERSRKELEDRFGVEVKDFAFPFGSMYACSKENIRVASGIFEHVFMTYALPYHESCGNIIPRINMNNDSYRKELL